MIDMSALSRPVLFNTVISECHTKYYQTLAELLPHQSHGPYHSAQQADTCTQHGRTSRHSRGLQTVPAPVHVTHSRKVTHCIGRGVSRPWNVCHHPNPRPRWPNNKLSKSDTRTAISPAHITTSPPEMRCLAQRGRRATSKNMLQQPCSTAIMIATAQQRYNDLVEVLQLAIWPLRGGTAVRLPDTQY